MTLSQLSSNIKGIQTRITNEVTTIQNDSSLPLQIKSEVLIQLSLIYCKLNALYFVLDDDLCEDSI